MQSPFLALQFSAVYLSDLLHVPVHSFGGVIQSVGENRPLACRVSCRHQPQISLKNMHQLSQIGHAPAHVLVNLEWVSGPELLCCRWHELH
jgi:hypothetical protein